MDSMLDEENIFRDCARCGRNKPLTEFGKANCKYGKNSRCKSCVREISAEQRARNPEADKAAKLAWRINNGQKQNALSTAWRKANPERSRANQAAWRAANKDRVRQQEVDRARRNPERGRAAAAKRRAERPEGVRAAAARFREKTRNDPRYKLNAAIRSGVYATLSRGVKQRRRTYALLGYSYEDLRAHLERQFQPGMSWENYGEWHIDHIVPLSAFNFSTPEHLDFARAWALANLRPLWKLDNLRKNARLSAPFQPSLAL